MNGRIETQLQQMPDGINKQQFYLKTNLKEPFTALCSPLIYKPTLFGLGNSLGHYYLTPRVKMAQMI